MNSVELKRYMMRDQCIGWFEICSADQLYRDVLSIDRVITSLTQQRLEKRGNTG